MCDKSIFPEKVCRGWEMPQFYRWGGGGGRSMPVSPRRVSCVYLVSFGQSTRRYFPTLSHWHTRRTSLWQYTLHNTDRHSVNLAHRVKIAHVLHRYECSSRLDTELANVKWQCASIPIWWHSEYLSLLALGLNEYECSARSNSVKICESFRRNIDGFLNFHSTRPRREVQRPRR